MLNRERGCTLCDAGFTKPHGHISTLADFKLALKEVLDAEPETRCSHHWHDTSVWKGDPQVCCKCGAEQEPGEMVE